MRIKKWIEEIIDPTKDKVTFKDTLYLSLIKENEKYKEWKQEANTWTSTGTALISDALSAGGFSSIAIMVMGGTPGQTMGTDNEATPANISTFDTTFTVASTGIGTFSLRQSGAGPDLATITLTPFNLPTGFSLVVAWVTTVT